MKQSPVKNKIGGVFIPVKNIDKAKEWYGRILGLNKGEIYFDHLFAADMEDGANLILDTMPKWHGETPAYQTPAIQFVTSDLEASFQYMKDNDVKLVTEIEDDFYFVFKALDGNMLMICKEI